MLPTESDLRAALDSPEALKPLLIALAQYSADEYEWEFEPEVFQDTTDYLMQVAGRLDRENPKVKARNVFISCSLCYLRQIRRRDTYAKLLARTAQLTNDQTRSVQRNQGKI